MKRKLSTIVPTVMLFVALLLMWRVILDNIKLTYQSDQQAIRISDLESSLDMLRAENEELANREPEVIVKEVYAEAEISLTDSEVELLARVVHAEAGNQDMIGKRLVADTVLNRVENDRFPNSVSAVICQENQYVVASDFNESDVQAVLDECMRRSDWDVLWFRTGDYHACGAPLFKHGAHFFSGEKHDEY